MNQGCGKVHCTQSHSLWGENSPRSFHGNDEREMKSPLCIYVLIQLKALCVTDTVSNINRYTYRLRDDDMLQRFNHTLTNKRCNFISIALRLL